MKIGILTQPLHNNYGGLLQNYALQQVLIGMGHEVETLDWKAKYSRLRMWLSRGKQMLQHQINKQMEAPRYKPTDAENNCISQHTHKFIERYISVCPYKAEKHDELLHIANMRQYEALVVGSDQVWRPDYNTWPAAMFFDFAEEMNIKRVAYAASFGTSAWEFSSAMTEKCSQLAKKFDLITVREKCGVDLCQEHLGVTATHVLDPTLLLNKEDYIHLVEAEKETGNAGTLFHYILDPSYKKKSLIDIVAARQGLTPFTIMPKCQAENRTKSDVKNRIEDCVFPSVTSWLRGIMDAKMIIVDSFHGAVFSIIFNKPFWVMANAERGNARFESLLGLFGLENRMISIDSLDENFDWNKAIDWEKVNIIRQKEVVRCKSLLKEALKQ